MHALRIAIPIFPRVDLIDVAAPVDVLSRISQFWKDRDVEVRVVAATLNPIMTGQNLPITPTATFADYAGAPPDVLLVPGATNTTGATGDKTFMDWVTAMGERARFVTSVCTGAIILAKAGLLNGYRATTHWAGIPELTDIEGVLVVNGYPRWVHDRNRVTGGGVSSSLDTAIYLVSILTNDDVAKCVQLLVQYNPHPPFTTGDPSVADPDTYLRVAYG